jgi:hypothetical protein
MTGTFGKACLFLAGKECLQEECMAWRKDDCSLIRLPAKSQGPFEQKLKRAAPLMYRSLLDLARVMEDPSKDCRKCGPKLCPGGQNRAFSMSLSGPSWQKPELKDKQTPYLLCRKK